MNGRETSSESVASNLALAVVSSSSAPLLLLDGHLTVVAASASFSEAFRIKPAAMIGRRLAALGGGEWRSPQLAALLTATASGHAAIDAYEMDLVRPDTAMRRLVLNAQKLDYGAESEVRLLLAVADVTDARIAEKLRDDLVREKGMLLLELQHRVANSLQIIASVLLQSARRVQSDETRSHLHAAHQRVMSVAAVQKQLTLSRTDDVGLRAYFKELCASLGASMIRDHTQLTLDSTADDTVTTADVSVSLGLIVTELVINALKHAFPEDRSGKINVDYQSQGPAWAMSVRDNGVGMQDTSSTPGLGTSIVNALATQLKADIVVTDNHPGTVISITHRDPVEGSDRKPEPAAV